MKRNLKRFIAFSLSLAIVGTGVNVPVSTVKANTLDKGTPFTGYNVVSSANDDVKFTKGADTQNKAKASKPDYWGILDGDTSLTKLGTYNEEEGEYTGEAGSGIVTWQNNANVKSSDMGNFKFRFDYLIKDGKGGRNLNAYDSNYSGNGDTYSDGDVCGFEFKPLYATSKIRVWGVSPYQNYTTGDVVIKASEADLEKMTLEYYDEKKSELDTIDLSTDARDGTYTLDTSKKGWYYLNYEDEGYMSDGMGDEVTGGAQENTKGQIFGFSFYTGNDSDTNIEKVKDHVNVSKSSTGKLQSVSIDSSDSNLTKITPLTYVVDNSGKVTSNSNSSTNLSSAKAVITTVREYYKVKEGNFYQTLTRVKTYYSEASSSEFKYSSGSYKYYRPEINVSTYSNYLPYIMKNYFASNFAKSNYVVFDKGSYNGNYKMKYQIPDASVSGGKKTIEEDILVDYGAPFIKVYDKDNSWKTMKSGGSYSVKNGATVKALDTFSNIRGINLSNIKYEFTKEGKTALEIDGTDLGATQSSSTGDISFKAVRNTGSYVTKVDNTAVATKSEYTSETDALTNASTYEFDINDNNKLTLQKVNKYDAITCSVDDKTPYTMDADLTVDQESSDTLDITNLFTKVGTYEFKVKYTANTIGEASNGVYSIASSTSYYSNFTVNVVDKKVYDADSVSVTIPTLKDDSLAENSLSGFTCTFNFVDGTASVPSNDPTGDDEQITAPTPKPEATEAPQTTESPSTTQAPTSEPTQTPEQCNLQDYWQDGSNTEIDESITLTWNKNLLEEYKSDIADEEVAFYVWEQGNDNKTFKDLTEETSIEVNKIGAWKFEYFDGMESHYFYITYIGDDIEVTPEPSETPEPTPATTEEPEKITGEDLDCVPVDDDGNPLKQQYVNGVTIKNIPESVTVTVDGDEVTDRPIKITERGKHTLEIAGKTYILEIVSAYDIFSESQRVIQVPKSITITDNNDKEISVDGEKITSFPYTLDTVGNYSIEVAKEGVEVNVVDYEGNPVLDENGNAIRDTVKSINSIEVSILPDVADKNIVGKEYTIDNLIKYSKEPNETLRGRGSVTITGISSSKIVYVDSKVVKGSSVTIVGDGSHYLTIYDIDSKDLKTVIVYVSTTDVSVDEIKDNDTIIADDSITITDIPDDVTVIVDGKEVTERPVVISDGGKHDIIIKDDDKETSTTVVITGSGSTVIDKEDIKDIIDNTPDGETPTIKGDDEVILDVPDDNTVIVDGEEVKGRPVIIDDNGKHEVVIKDPETGGETKIDVIIDSNDKVVVNEDEIKDIVENTPEGETPVISGDKEVIIDVPDGVPVIVDGEEVTERPIKIDDGGKHEVIIKDPNTGEETKVDVIIGDKDKETVVDEEDIKDIVDNTPDGETPTIKDDNKVVIDVPDGVDVTVDGEEVADRPIKITDKGEHDVVIKDPGTGKETHIKVEIGKDKENEKDPVYDLGDIEDGKVTGSDEPSDKGDEEGNDTGTGSKTDVETPITPVVSYISGIVNNGIYMNGVKIVNNGFTIYVTKDGGEHKTYTSSLIELNEAGKYKIEAEKDNEIKYTFNIEIVVKEVDTSKTETADKDTIKDGGVYEGGVTIPNDGDDPIYVDGKPIIGTPVVITDPGKHEIVIDGEVITIIIPENTKPDGGVDSSKPIKPIELPSSDKLLNGETYPGGVIIPKPENGDKVIVDGKEVKEFPYTVTGDGEHTIQIGDNEPIKIIVKDTEIPDIPIIDTGATPSPSPTAPTGSNDNKNNNSNKDNNIKETPKPSDNSYSGNYSGVKNKKSYKKSVKITLKNVKSGSASYKKSKKSKAKVSKFGSGTVVYRASKQGTYTIKVTYKNGKRETIKFTIDKKKPTVNVKSGKKYKKGKKVIVKDSLSGIKKVTLNGKKCKTKFKLKKKGKNTIRVWDKAGNKRTIKVKVK